MLIRPLNIQTRSITNRTISDKPIHIAMNYLQHNLQITIKQNDPFWDLMRSMKTPVIMIENYTYSNSEQLTNDVNHILNSVLFDLNYNFNLQFEPITTQRFLKKPLKKKRFPLPKEPIHFVYKKYNPTLFEYFRIAEKVDYLPFKYLCYFYVIEYFMDKSAYFLVAQKVKSIIQMPDFHLRMDHYVGEAINIFKRENDKHQSDLIKIERVLNQFIEREELKNILTDLNINPHFESDCHFSCYGKELILPKIDFTNDSNYIRNLTKRIYSLRCSIVHSNPDFDDKKAIPFMPSISNFNILSDELPLIHEIAKLIIIKSVE